MAHSVHLWTDTQRYWARILAGSDICHRGCVHTVLQSVQMPGVYSAVYGTVHYNNNNIFNNNVLKRLSPHQY